SRRRHTRCLSDWSSDVCSSDLRRWGLPPGKSMTHLFTMDLPGGRPQRLTTGNAREFQPAWSSDGKSIAYVTWSSDGGQLWKIPAAGGTPVQLSKSLAVYSNPAWSPDGTKIVLLRGNAYDREN